MTLRLTRTQRAKLFQGETPRISGDGPCPVEKGYVLHLSRRVELHVLEVVRNRKGGWSLRYELTDKRDSPLFLRRTPAIHSHDFDSIRKSFDEYGYPGDPTPDALRRAARESAYTNVPVDRLDAGEVLDDEALKPIVEANKERARREREIRRRQQANLGTEARIAEYRREAAHRRIDIRNEVRLIGRLKAQGKPIDNPVLGIRRKLDSDLDKAA